MNVTLLIPDLLTPPAPLEEVGDGLPPLPSLRRVLGRADRDRVPGHDLEDTLCWLAGFETVPAGALTALAAGDEPGNAAWVRLDPVHLAADPDGLRLIAGDALAVTDDEAAALTTWLVTQSDIPVRAAGGPHWYAPYDAIGASLPAPSRVLGRAVEPPLPPLLNELQMVLHDHPVNRRRRDRGALAVNSVWPWGAGPLATPAGDWPHAWVYSDEPVLAGVAQWHGGQATATPTGLAQVTESGSALVRLDAVHEAARLRDVERWHEALGELERDWFAPALAGLAAGNLRSLTVLDGAGHRYAMRPAMRWRFWRRDHGLEAD